MIKYRNALTKKLFLIVILTVTGCVRTYTVDLSKVSDVTFSEINEKIERKNVTITMLDGQRHSGRRLHLAADSSTWIDTNSDAIRMVATSTIEEVKFKRVSRYHMLFASGAIVAATALILLPKESDNGDSTTSRGPGITPGVLVGVGVTAIIAGQIIGQSKTTFVFALPIPEFPWPPPEASASMLIPGEFWGALSKDAKFLKSIDSTLVEALNACGYIEKSYYAVPGGFAIVTRLEQFYEDGTPKELPDRWSTEVGHLKTFSLKEYIKALFTARPGLFRVVVFIVTPYPFTQSKVKVSREEVMWWLKAGVNKLPDDLSMIEYSNQYTITALIYEFKKLDVDQNANQQIPGILTGKGHLEKNGFIKALTH